MENIKMKQTNKYNIKPEWVDFINSFDAEYDGPSAYDSKNISVTTLIDSPYIRQLKIHHWDELEKDVRDKQFSVLGSMVHLIFENAPMFRDNEYIKMEERLELPFGDMILSGKYDRLEIMAHDINKGNLVDIKSTGVFSAKSKDKLLLYFKQVNVYRYLVKEVKGIDVKTAQLAIVMRDWRTSEFNRFNDYATFAFDTIKVPIAPYEDIKKYIEGRIKLHSDANKTPLTTPPCTDAENWTDEPMWAAVVNGEKRSRKNFKLKEEAEQFVKELTGEGQDASLEERPPKKFRNRCKGNYCDVSNVCPSFKKWKEENE